MAKATIEPPPETRPQAEPAVTERSAVGGGASGDGAGAVYTWRRGHADDDAHGLNLTIGGLVALGAVLALLIGIFAGFSGHGAGTSAASAPATGNQSQTQTQPRSGSQVQFKAPDHPTYDAHAPAAPNGSTVDVKLVAQESLISIAPGIAYHGWTFNGTVPGPVIRVRQGQTVNFTLTNNTGMGHSIDFHAAETPWNVNYQEVAAGKSFSFSWQAMYPGVFMYHCGTPPVLEHIANGMYGMVIVDPANGWAPADEYAIVQSEFYTLQQSDGSYVVDMTKALADQPDYVVFNGYANQYKDAPLIAHAGKRIRLFVVNAGPSQFSAFHIIGAMFDKTYMDGNPANVMVGNQTVTIPPGGAAAFELVIPQAGSYPFLTHSFADASKGAVGVVKVEP